MKNPGPLLITEQLGGEDPIPVEFRAAMQRIQEVQENPVETGPEELSDLIVESRVEQDRTDERKRITIKKIAGNIVLLWTNTNDQGQPVQITRTMFPTGTTPDVPTATTSVSVKDQGNGWSIQETSIEGTYVGDPPVFTPGVFPANAYSAQIPDVIPQDFQALLPTTTTKLESAGTAVAPTISGDELSETQEQLTQFKKRVTTTSRATPELPAALEGAEVTEHGVASIARILDTAPQGVTAGTLILSSVETPLGNGLSILETHELAAFPELISEEMDPVYLITWQTKKKFVPVASVVEASISFGEITEYQSYDSVKAIRLKTKALTLPANKTWYEVGQASFPDELLSIAVSSKIIVDISVTTSGGSTATTIHSSVDAFLDADIHEGYSGPVTLKVTEKFSVGPPVLGSIPTIVQWFPQAHTFLIVADNTFGSDIAYAGRQVTLPATLHDAITDVNIPSQPIAATDPIALPHGDYVVQHVEAQPWRLNIWRLTIYEMLVP